MSLDYVTADDESQAAIGTSPLDPSDPQHELAAARETLVRLLGIVKETVIGRDEVIELCIIALVSDGHVLLEDFPGSGKTTLAKAFSHRCRAKVGTFVCTFRVPKLGI